MKVPKVAPPDRGAFGKEYKLYLDAYMLYCHVIAKMKDIFHEELVHPTYQRKVFREVETVNQFLALKVPVSGKNRKILPGPKEKVLNDQQVVDVLYRRRAKRREKRRRKALKKANQKLVDIKLSTKILGAEAKLKGLAERVSSSSKPSVKGKEVAVESKFQLQSQCQEAWNVVARKGYKKPPRPDAKKLPDKYKKLLTPKFYQALQATGESPMAGYLYEVFGDLVDAVDPRHANVLRSLSDYYRTANVMRPV